MAELKPCPFCGGAARIESNRDWHRIYAAHDDDCVLDADEADLTYPARPEYLTQIAEDWNRRAPHPAGVGHDGAHSLPREVFKPDDWHRNYVQEVADTMDHAQLAALGRAVEPKGSAPNLDKLLSDLDWCIQHGCSGLRTQATLQAARAAIAGTPEETDHRQAFQRQYLGEPLVGAFFPKVPLLTDKQEQEARQGICPGCGELGLIPSGEGCGLRFMGCLQCQSVTVLPARPDDRQLLVMNGHRFGRTHLAQQVSLAMRMYRERGGDADGYCREGELCVCGGDTPGVRAGCSRWVKGDAA